MSIQNDRPVNFIICGTQKGGTTALDAYLREHPEICMADRKETHFFDNEANFSGGKPEYSKYHALFKPLKKHKSLGEATPIYMYWQNSPRRIWEYNPHIKLIILLRNPIERAYSHWNMERLRGADDLSFWDAIVNEKERCREAFPQQHRVYSYVDRGFYMEQLQRIWSYFPKNRVLIIKSENLRTKPYQTLNGVCDFLEVGRFKNISIKDINSRAYELPMSAKERNYLRALFTSEIKKMETLLNWDCRDWLQGENTSQTQNLTERCKANENYA